MIGADIVTYYYKDGTTMRGMQFDPNVSENKKKVITLFHSKMQLCATTYMLGNIDSAFSPLFAIQFSSFLMTLVRKNIIKRNHWHLLYSLSNGKYFRILFIAIRLCHIPIFYLQTLYIFAIHETTK